MFLAFCVSDFQLLDFKPILDSKLVCGLSLSALDHEKVPPRPVNCNDVNSENTALLFVMLCKFKPKFYLFKL